MPAITAPTRPHRRLLDPGMQLQCRVEAALRCRGAAIAERAQRIPRNGVDGAGGRGGAGTPGRTPRNGMAEGGRTNGGLATGGADGGTGRTGGGAPRDGPCQ